MIGMTPDHHLDRGRHALSILAHALFVIARHRHLHHWQYRDAMMRGVALADHKSRHHRRVSRHRNSRHPIAGGSLRSEEVRENSSADIEVECNSNLPFPMEIFDHRETCLFALDDLGAKAGSHAADPSVNERVAQWTIDHREPMPVDRVRKRQQLEIPIVGGQDDCAALSRRAPEPG